MRLDPGQIEVIDDAMAAVLRSKTGAERLAIASDLYSSARQMLFSLLRSDHPEWSEDELTRAVNRRMQHESS